MVKRRGPYADGGGLYRQVTHGVDGAPRRSWVLRYSAPGGRRREMGLGDARLVSLAAAREAALDARKLAKAGIDPIEARQATRVKAKAAHAKAATFRQCAEAYIAGHVETWKNAKHRWQWENTLQRLVYPVFGDIPVDRIDANLVLKAIEPIWIEKTETASRLRGRIETILDWAAVRGLRSGENPARWRGHLQLALPTIKKSARVRHHPALPYAEIPEFMRKLACQDGISARALAFCILTAARTGEVIHARWSEIDMGERVWIVPAERMKMGRERRVPLPDQALAILRGLHGTGSGDGAFIFPGQRVGRPLSNMALLMTLKRMGRGDLTTHGFRSSFRDWVAEQTNFPGEVAAAALAHAIGDQVEAAYRRGDLFNKRRRLMAAWSDYCAPATRRAPTA